MPFNDAKIKSQKRDQLSEKIVGSPVNKATLCLTNAPVYHVLTSKKYEKEGGGEKKKPSRFNINPLP